MQILVLSHAYPDIHRFEFQKFDKASRVAIAKHHQCLNQLSPSCQIAEREINLAVKALSNRDCQDAKKIAMLRQEGRLRIIDKQTGAVYYHCELTHALQAERGHGIRVCILNRTTGHQEEVEEVDDDDADVYNYAAQGLEEAIEQNAEQQRLKAEAKAKKHASKTVTTHQVESQPRVSKSDIPTTTGKFIKSIQRHLQAALAESYFARSAKVLKRKREQVENYRKREEIEELRDLKHDAQRRTPTTAIKNPEPPAPS